MEIEHQEILYWNKAAADYGSRRDELASIYQSVVEQQLGDVSGKRISDWVMDENEQRLYKKITNYLTPKMEVLNFWGKTLHFHRPLYHYFDELAKNAFCVETFKEPITSGETIEKHQGWECHRRVPSFVVMKAILKRS